MKRVPPSALQASQKLKKPSTVSARLGALHRSQGTGIKEHILHKGEHSYDSHLVPNRASLIPSSLNSSTQLSLSPRGSQQSQLGSSMQLQPSPRSSQQSHLGSSTQLGAVPVSTNDKNRPSVASSILMPQSRTGTQMSKTATGVSRASQASRASAVHPEKSDVEPGKAGIQFAEDLHESCHFDESEEVSGAAEPLSPLGLHPGIGGLHPGLGNVAPRRTGMMNARGIPQADKRKSTRYGNLADHRSQEFGDADLESESGIAVCLGDFRMFVQNVMFSQSFEMFVGVVVLANFGLIATEIEARATFKDNMPGTQVRKDAEQTLNTIEIINWAFFIFYFLECGFRMFAMKAAFFQFKWNLFDLAMVLLGVFMLIFEAFLVGDDSNSPETQVVRILKMLRLLRASRILISFQSLYVLVSGLFNCFQTLMWAAGLVFMMLTVWSIIAVEYIHPLMKPLEEQGHFKDCFWCSTAFQTILQADLTFFQMITGDGWSDVARPLIETHPWTALIFASVIFTMVLGLLNLITAVIVDTAARAQDHDIMVLSQRKKQERAEAFACFRMLCVDLDKDGNGDISLEELRRGVPEIPELDAYLSIMGVEDDELAEMFKCLDTNSEGSISHEEFAYRLYKMKTQECTTAVSYIKHCVDEIRQVVSTDRSFRQSIGSGRLGSEEMVQLRGHSLYSHKESEDSEVSRDSVRSEESGTGSVTSNNGTHSSEMPQCVMRIKTTEMGDSTSMSNHLANSSARVSVNSSGSSMYDDRVRMMGPVPSYMSGVESADPGTWLNASDIFDQASKPLQQTGGDSSNTGSTPIRRLPPGQQLPPVVPPVRQNSSDRQSLIGNNEAGTRSQQRSQTFDSISETPIRRGTPSISHKGSLSEAPGGESGSLRDKSFEKSRSPETDEIMKALDKAAGEVPSNDSATTNSAEAMSPSVSEPDDKLADATGAPLPGYNTCFDDPKSLFDDADGDAEIKQPTHGEQGKQFELAKSLNIPRGGTQKFT